MKKLRILIMLLLLIIIPFNGEAATIGGVRCTYNLVNPFNESIGKAQVVIDNYNSSPSVKVYYESKDGSMKEYKSPNYDYKNYNQGSLTNLLRFFTIQKKNKFTDAYKKEGKCPNIYSNFTSSMTSYDIELSVIDSTDKNSFKNISSSKEELKEPGSSTWKSRSEFNKDNNVTEKADRVCKYTMVFDLYETTSEVELRTIYNTQNNKKTYKLTVNDNSNSTDSLDSELTATLGLSNSGFVRITPSEMKKLFKDGACVSSEKVYHYLDSKNATEGVYYITTSKEDAKNNGTAGRYDNGNGSTDGTGGSTKYDDNISAGGFGKEGQTCIEVVGESLSKIIKTTINILRIAGAVIAILKGMTLLIPPIVNKDADSLKKAGNKCIKLAIVLLLIGVFPTIIRFIGYLFKYDVTCIF